ncbi:type I-D CRISPR-associated protein Cas7/Csc2 [Salinibaculum rarum]|uniref:type I-D CRISPR-associated protein Cas7/Csc2 n=1 Tax=Salinibaculum rarum TaxID=3058903 RepID=UPI00266034FA|nr:type I-D CRISPR-associated protein Cas7/Csc2 [Salinibaculum sp. KK48]
MTVDIDFPEKGLIDSFELYRRRKPSVTLILKRDVVTPVLFRNTEDERAEMEEFNNTLHAQVNGEKFVSKERQTGLDLLRSFDDSELIDPEYAYNEPTDMEETLNLGTLTYGIAGTGDNEFGIKSRVIEGYTYTTDEYDIMDRETRNAVYESGTMQDEDHEQSSALFDHVTVDPGNSFVHFLTLEAGTPAMLAYVLHNVLTTGVYGARETRSGRTIRNNILGVVLSDHTAALSTGELLHAYHNPGDDIVASVNEYVNAAQRQDWEVYSDELDAGESYPEWWGTLTEVAGRQHPEAKDTLYELFADATTEARDILLDTDDE